MDYINGKLSGVNSINQVLLDIEELTANKQGKLYSGINLKTVDNNSLLGSGNVETRGRLTEEIVTKLTVGGVTAGTTFTVGTPMEDILHQIFNSDKQLRKIEWKTGYEPRAIYYVGQAFSLGDAVLIATYNYGPTEEITSGTSGVSFTPTGAFTEAGEQNITIKYNNYGEASLVYTVLVKPVESLDVCLQNVGDSSEQTFPVLSDITGMHVQAVSQISDLVGKHFYTFPVNKTTGVSGYDTIAIPGGFNITDWSTDDAGTIKVNWVTVGIISTEDPSRAGYTMYRNTNGTYVESGCTYYITIAEDN